MVDDLTQQQPTNSSQANQIPQTPQVPEAPQTETPQDSVQPPVENPVTSPVDNQSIPTQNQQPVSPENPESPQLSQSPQIPQFRLPFNGDFPITFSFGAEATTDEMKQKFSSWGITGHHGLDFRLPEGSEVLAVDSGKIVQSGDKGDFGISITIQHPWGLSFYAHLKESKVIVDQTINAGDVIGLSGQTGSAYGAHLHFGIKPNNPDVNNGYLGFIDPLPYLPAEALAQAGVPLITPISPISQTESPQSEPVAQSEPISSQPIIEVTPTQLVENTTPTINIEPQISKESQLPQSPISSQDIIIDEAEVDRRAQEKLLVELEVRRQKANQTRQNKKQDNLSQIEKLIQVKGKITNNDVCDFLHVSQSTATNYLHTLISQGKIKSEGKGRATIYKSILS